MQEHNFEDENFLDDTTLYNAPENKDIILDVKNNTTIKTSDLSPIELIYLTAREQKIPIKQFEIKNGIIETGCKKKDCYGRGYKGFVDGGKIPIPCSCLFEKKTEEEMNMISVNRKNVRTYERALQKDGQKLKEKQMKEMGLKSLGNGVYGKVKKGTSEMLKYEWVQYEKKWCFSRIKEKVEIND